MNIHQDKILIIDFGSQYTQLIARRIRELGVYCEIHSHAIAAEKITSFAPKGIILSGGPQSVTDENSLRLNAILFQLNIPVLGICYGMQAMAHYFGGQVMRSDKREYGAAQLTLLNPSILFEGMGSTHVDVWMSHGDCVSVLPKDFICVAETENAGIAAMMHETQPWFGVQFHPEVTHTPQGLQLLRQFLFSLCQCEAEWTADNIIEDAIQTIKKQVGTSRVVLGLSGGVDSSVVAALLHQAIGSQLTCIFVDTGLLRYREREQVEAMFSKHFPLNLLVIDAREIFFTALKGKTDPEEKRKIIGKLFIDIFEAEAEKIKDAVWLAQGTIYPDVIESAAAQDQGAAAVIKSHHNVGGLPLHMRLKLLEPLRELFKDEVRKMGLQLGLPQEMVYRHPFPGPGLAVRVLGEVKESYVDILRIADAIFIEELRKADWYDKVSQAFAVFLPVKSVAVLGDGRQYDYVIALRAVNTIDFMTATWTPLPYDLLGTVSQRIINEVKGVSRVTYDISGKPPATIEWE